MRIKKRLQINFALSLLTVFVIFLVLSLSLYRLNKANNLEKIVDEIKSGAFERVALRNDYIRNNTDRAKEQWYAKHAQVGRFLKSAMENFRSAEERKNVAGLIEVHEAIGKIFSAIVANRERSSLNPDSAALSREVEERLLNQLDMRVYGVAILNRQLLKLSTEERDSALRMAGGGILSALLILVASAMLNSWTMSRTITTRVLRLRDGASMIGEGNLDHRIDVRGDDEFAVLSEAFNTMTAKLRGSYSVLQNEITDRKRAEEGLRESEQKYRNLFENMVEEVHFWQVVRDEDGRIKTWRLVDVNPPTLKSWGRRTAEEIRGKTTDEIFGPGATEHYMPVVEKIMTEGIPYSFEDYFPNLGKHFRFTSVPLGDFFITTGADITSIKKAEEALRKSEQRLARAQEIAHLGSWELDLLKNELTWSDEVYRIFGLQPQEFGATYEAFIERVHPEDRSAVDTAYAESVREGRDSYEIEHRVVRKGTGEIRWVHEKCQHIRDSSGNIIRSVGMVHDITERKKAEEELHKLTEELRRSNSDLEQFAYIASHDLQSPLRNVEGFVQLLARRYKGKLDGKADEFIQYISTGVKDMQMLILDILEYSKVGSASAAFSKMDISLCISKALANLKDAVAEKNADIVLEEPFPAVSGDSVQITSLFQNLIGNAIKFCTEKPIIQISAKKEGLKYVFSVRDNGIGINTEDSDKIFAVFHRLHSKTEYPGTGIGLAICKKIVQRHGGRIWVESEPGKGSTFFFSLPAKE